MSGGYTSAGAGNVEALSHAQALIETAVQDSHRPEDEAAVAAINNVITSAAAARRLLDSYQSFIGDLNDQVNIMAGRGDVREVISKMLFGFGAELRKNPDVGTLLEAEEVSDVH